MCVLVIFEFVYTILSRKISWISISDVPKGGGLIPPHKTNTCIMISIMEYYIEFSINYLTPSPLKQIRCTLLIFNNNDVFW